MWSNGSDDIKFIFLGIGILTVACYWNPHVSPMPCSIMWAWHIHLIKYECLTPN